MLPSNVNAMHQRQPQQSPSANAQEKKRLEQAVLVWLYRQGYTNAERELCAEVVSMGKDVSLHTRNFIRTFAPLELSPDVYAHLFLKSYRADHEHLHGRELVMLQSLRKAEDLAKSEIAMGFTNQKATVKLSQYSHHLLGSFLKQSQMMLIDKTLNDRVIMRVVSTCPVTLASMERDMQSSPSPVKVHWGVLESQANIIKVAMNRLASASAPDSMSTSAPAQYSGRAAATTGSAGELVREGSSEIPKLEVPRETVSDRRTKTPNMSEAQKRQYMHGLINRAKVSRTMLPSVAFYTFLHAVDRVTTVSVCRSGSLVAAGCGDSTVRVWDLSVSDPESMLRRPLNVNVDAKGKLYPDEYDDDGGVNNDADGDDGDEEQRSRNKRRRTMRQWQVDLGQVYDYMDEENDDWSVSKLVSRTISGGDEDNYRFNGNVDRRGYVKYVGHSGPVYSTSFSPDERFLLSASEDATVRLWSNELKRALVCYKGHNYPVWDVQFAPLGVYFVTGSFDRTARLWRTDRTVPVRIFAGHDSDVDCVQFHQNCNYIATGSSDKTVRLWDVLNGNSVRLFQGHTDAVTSLAFSPDGQYLASGGADHSVQLWDISSGKLVQKLEGHTNTVTSLSFSEDGSVLVSGGADCQVMMWDANHALSMSLHSSRGRKFAHNASGDPESDSNTIDSDHNARSPLIKVFPTKSTPVSFLRFTPSNVVLAAGIFRNTASTL